FRNARRAHNLRLGHLPPPYSGSRRRRGRKARGGRGGARGQGWGAGVGSVLGERAGMHELAYGITSNNPHFGTIRNPRDPQRIPGGSSGGSGAAVASEMVFMAMGSDTGGSIRIPASFCGTVGLKPTSGRVSRYGVMPLDFSLDHMGPLTRSVRDAAVTLQAIAGFDSRDDT